MYKKGLTSTILVIIASSILILTSSCSPLRTAGEIKMSQQWKGLHCGYRESAKLVIRTEDQWREVWEKVHRLQLPRSELPKINFEKKMVVAVFMGECTSGGYSIEIIKIIKTVDEIIVEVKEKEPPSESLRTLVLTQPYHIVVVKSSLLPVRFQHP